MISFLLVFCYIWYNELGGDSMNEIKCPHCGTVFQIQETDYLAIVKQVRDKEFASPEFCSCMTKKSLFFVENKLFFTSELCYYINRYIRYR